MKPTHSTIRLLILTTMAMTASTAGRAEVVASAPDHYKLRHEAKSSLTPDALWRRLIDPSSWWSGAHSYSGDASNLSLDAVPGGLWKESWDGGAVAHGEVLFVKDGETLRLDAPFGPLQGMAVNVVWTITVKPDGDGSVVTFDEIANGSAASALDKIAPAVDGVKLEAITNLAKTP